MSIEKVKAVSGGSERSAQKLLARQGLRQTASGPATTARKSCIAVEHLSRATLLGTHIGKTAISALETV